MPIMDDMDLLREYATRDSETAFETLVNRHVNLVYSAAFRQVRDPGLAGEVTQTVFIILAKKARTLRRGTILSGWLYRTARFAAANALRTECRRRKHEQEAFQMKSEPADSTWDQIAPLLDEAMAHLGESDRNAVVLRYFENKNLREVGVALGTSERAAQKRVARATEKLRFFFTRQGMVLPAACLATVLSAHGVQAAPAGIASLAAAAGVLKGAAAASSTSILLKGTLKLMAWTKLKASIAVGVGVLLAAGTTTIVVNHQFSDPQEPSYQGKRLSEWLPDLAYGQPHNKQETAGDAIRHMGAKTLPFLLRSFETSPHVRGRQANTTGNGPPDPGQAVGAFQALGSAGKSAIPEIERLLEQKPGFAPLALAGIGRDAMPSIIKALNHHNVYVRDNTAAGLANALFSEKIRNSDAQAVLPIAIRDLKDTNTNIRLRAAGLLLALHLAPDRSVPPLAAGLEDTNILVAERCAQALGTFGEEAQSAVPALVKASDSSDQELGCAATCSLTLIDAEATAEVTAPKLVAFLGNSDPRIRWAAIQSLARLGSEAKAAVPRLIKCLHDGETFVRVVTIQSLGQIAANPETAVPALCESLHDSDSGVRRASAAALGKFGPAARSAIPALLAAAKADPEVGDNVSKALSEIDPEHF